MQLIFDFAHIMKMFLHNVDFEFDDGFVECDNYNNARECDEWYIKCRCFQQGIYCT